MTSSQELHPASGARFVCEREGEAYRYEIFAAGGATWRGALRWDAGGQAVAEPAVPDAWAQEELLKLARVLRRNAQARLSRWRGP